MSDGAEDANRDGELSAGESDPRIDDASAHPMLPEPLLFDLVRGLGAHRGELEANTLVTLGRGPVHYAPEVEWVFANGHAVELELPMHGTSLDAVKVALQGTLHRRADGRFVHGWQAFTQIGVHTRDRGVVTTWIASGTIGARGSYVLMVGAGATIQAQGPALGTVIVNASVFRALDTHTRVGVEATTSSDVLGRTRVVATLLLLPWFGASEWLLRGQGVTGLWLPAAGKLLTLIVVGAAALTGLLPFVILLGMASIALFFAFFELVATRLGRVMPNPWLAALFQAAFTGTAFATIFPYEP